MIKVDENDPVGELQPSFPYRDVTIKRNVDVNEYYELESEIGRGKFGTVYRCKEKSTGLTLAAKFVGIARRQDRRNVEREVEIMRTLQHPRLIQLYDAFEANSVMCVIQELIEGGELFERVIDDDFILTEKACTVFMRQICEGVEFIHSQNIIHLDLKPENILCLTRTGNRIKIIDFGLARKFEPDKKLQVLFGTPEFVAPEVVNFEQIGFGTDMWSVGVICYVLLSGLSPFMGETDVETMANVTIAQYDFDDEAFDDISDDAKNFISKLLTKNKEQRLTATECLTHVWLRRKPPPPPPPQLIQPKQGIELIPQLATNEILDNTKENLREFVDRWNEQEVTSPSKVIVSPSSVPFKEINDENIKSPQIINDINKNLIKDDVKIIPDISSITKMDIDKNVSVINNQQNITDNTIINVNKNDKITSDATQIDFGNEIPGKKIKLDDSLNNTIFSDFPKSSVDQNVPSVTKLPPEKVTNLNNVNENLNVLPPLTISLPSSNFNNTNNIVSRTPSDQNVNLNATKKTINSLPSPTISQPSSPIGTIPKTPSGSNLKFTPGFNQTGDKNKKQESLSPHFVKKELQTEISKDSGIAVRTPSSDKINKVINENIQRIETNNMKQPHIAKSPDNSSTIITDSSQFNKVLPQNQEKLPVTQKETSTDKNSGYMTGSKLIETSHKPPSEMNVIGSKSNETIHIPPHVPNVVGSKSNEAIHKPPHVPNVVGSKSNETIHKPPHVPTVTASKSNEIVHKPSHISNIVESSSNEAIHKPLYLPNTPRPKLLPQFSVPNDLSKCTLNKNVPVSGSLLKESTFKKSSNENAIAKTDSKSNINYVDTKELTTTDGKFNKTLNKHVIPPKIHGIVLGQNDNQDSNDTLTLAEKKGPKVITHKIFVEGRTDPVLPPAVPSSVNKENKKNENRVQKPISKSQTLTKLELKENSGIKNKPLNSRFFDNDRFDRRGSDISCFLHNTENLERINLAEEIKKLSSRLFQMGNNTTDEQQNNSNNNNNTVSNPIPISSYKNDPIGRFLANHGLVSRRPKYRMSNLNRDVPIGSPPPASNLFYHLSHSNSDTWSDNQTHSAPQSPSASPERETGRLTKEVILRLFDKNNPDNNTSPPKEVEEKHPAMSSIDSLASYFKTNNETKKNNVPPTVTSK